MRERVRAARSSTTGRPYSFSDRKSTRLNSSHGYISYAVFCLKKKNRRKYPSDEFERADSHLFGLIRTPLETLRNAPLRWRATCYSVRNNVYASVASTRRTSS